MKYKHITFFSFQLTPDSFGSNHLPTSFHAIIVIVIVIVIILIIIIAFFLLLPLDPISAVHIRMATDHPVEHGHSTSGHFL